eukprot:GHUV01031037.1.p1 GENE.GHUV01031037.1~~GHUV01031037.1.p1  ORF type:complete len:340 (+),score=98.04 GHUV01031037.1:1336-2355(+)
MTEQLLPSLLRPQQLLCNKPQHQPSQSSGRWFGCGRWRLLRGKQHTTDQGCPVLVDSTPAAQKTPITLAGINAVQSAQSVVPQPARATAAAAEAAHNNSSSLIGQHHSTNSSPHSHSPNLWHVSTLYQASTCTNNDPHSHSQILWHTSAVYRASNEQAADISAPLEQLSPLGPTHTAYSTSSIQPAPPFNLNHSVSRGFLSLGSGCDEDLTSSNVPRVGDSKHIGYFGSMHGTTDDSTGCIAAQQSVQMQLPSVLQGPSASQLAQDPLFSVHSTAGPVGEATEDKADRLLQDGCHLNAQKTLESSSRSCTQHPPAAPGAAGVGTSGMHSTVHMQPPTAP